MNILDQWETDSRENIEKVKKAKENDEVYITLKTCNQDERIVTLINLLRNKDMILEEINYQAHSHEGSLNYKWLQEESARALALTEELDNA